MSATGHQRIDWTAAPIVMVDLPTCAYCNGTKFDTRRSSNNGDGSRTKLAICRSCGQPFKISAEIPESGNVVWPVS